MRTKIKELSKNTLHKLESIKKQFFGTKEYLNDDFFNKFNDIVKEDIKLIKECSESSIIDFYCDAIKILLSKDNSVIDDGFWDSLKHKARMSLANKYVSTKTFDNTIDTYFNEVKREYILHPMQESDDLEFLPENKEVFIKNNLKLVINCAKRYQNLGIEFEDLIQIGNYGLLKAWDKFDISRANLKNDIKKSIKENPKDSFTFDEASNIVEDAFKYTKLLTATTKKIPQKGFSSKDEFYEWCDNNIKKATFSSIAFIWVRATILNEISKYANTIYIPKSKLVEHPNTIIRLDSINPHTDDNYYDNQISDIANEEFAIEDEKMENNEKKEMMSMVVNKVLNNLSLEDRIIVKKRFGIGLPFPLSINEIADSENMSANHVKYIILNSMKTINKKLSDKEKDIIKSML